LVTLDTSALYIALDRTSHRHAELLSFFAADRGPFIIPAGIMAEVTYLIETRLGSRTLELFLEDIDLGSYALDCGERDLPRVRELIRRHDDMPLGYADASVIACAERNGGCVATIDLRHFAAVVREGTIQIVP
jgi:predicted nucleic acid-binding protein